MDTIERDRDIIESMPIEYTKIPDSHGDFRSEEVFDRTRDHYLLMNVVWDNKRRVHGRLVRIDLIDGKLGSRRDRPEHGVATGSPQAGLSKDRNVLAVKSPERRRLTEFAVT